VLAISTFHPVWLQDLVDTYHTDPSTAKILTVLAIKSPYGHFIIQQGVIKYKGKI
jgi:hypothetical protein